MCIFSGTEKVQVTSTNIFARMGLGGRQWLAYSMTYQASTDLAMILPIPTPPRSAEDTVRFIDLSEYSDFFEALASAFPMPKMREFPSILDVSKSRAVPLRVHDVGSFEASFVPHQDHFIRLDPRFTLDPEIWRQMPVYEDFGFCVFKLKPGKKKIHPMAFSFTTGRPFEMFFPTVHVHDGRVSGAADFDHALYAQTPDPPHQWSASPERAGVSVTIGKTAGLVNGSEQLWRRKMVGRFPNADIWIQEPL